MTLPRFFDNKKIGAFMVVLCHLGCYVLFKGHDPQIPPRFSAIIFVIHDFKDMTL